MRPESEFRQQRPLRRESHRWEARTQAGQNRYVPSTGQQLGRVEHVTFRCSADNSLDCRGRMQSQSEFRQSRPPQRREPNGQEAPQRRDPRGQEAPQNGAGPSTGQRPGRVEYVPVRETGDDRAGRG